MKPIGVGIVGYGFSAQTFHAPFLRELPEFSLRAVSSGKGHDLANVALHPTAEGVLKESAVELVVVTVPTHAHFSVVKAALEAGKHVVVDKPFTATVEEGEELLQLAERKGLILSVFQNRRWDGDFLTIKKLLAEGVLGEVLLMESRFDRFRPAVQPSRWRDQPLPGSGILFDLGSHLVDQAFSLFGPPDRVEGSAALQREGATAPDYFHLTLHYGVRRVMLRASSVIADVPARFELHGTKGSFVKFGLDPQEDALKSGVSPLTPDWGREPSSAWGELTLPALPEGQRVRKVETEAGDYMQYYRQLGAAVRQGSPAPVLASDALQVIRLLERAQS
jgi:scyllo-inositol 2-dehydrogenase (NADP+)